MKTLPILLAMLIGLWPVAGLSEFSGPVRVIDGDTFQVGDHRVRLQGIDAPEEAQTCTDATGRVWACGDWVTRTVADRLNGAALTCDDRGRDAYGRVLARCRSGRDDIGAALVADGLAVAYRRYSLDYLPQEARARAAGRGIWAGVFMSPEDFRAQARAAPSAAPDPDCAIKGNLSRSGAIYHLPGQRFYSGTRIRPEDGERWFCNEAEARAAGWRPARR